MKSEMMGTHSLNLSYYYNLFIALFRNDGKLLHYPLWPFYNRHILFVSELLSQLEESRFLTVLERQTSK